MFSPDANVSPYHPPPPAVNADGTPLPGPERGRVTHSATRLPSQSESSSASVPPSPTRSRIGAAISGTPYHRNANVEDIPKVGGYGFVDALPSPEPSKLGPEAMKELMTWGTLLGTPRIIRDDDGPNATGEPSFSSSLSSSSPFTISHPTTRDALGRRLGTQASRSLREKAALLSSGSTPLAGGGGIRKRKPSGADMDMPPPSTPHGRNADLLSPAARVLLGRTKTGNALGLTPRSTGTSGSGSGRGRGSVDLRNVGWSPASTPVSSGSGRRRGNGNGNGSR